MSTLALRLVPAGVPVVATALAVAFPGTYESAAELVPAGPYAIFVGAVLLAWRFERSRVMLLALMLATAEQTLRWSAGSASGSIVAAGVAVVLPPTLAALAWLPERGPLVPRLAWTVLVIAVEGLLIALLCQPEAAPAAEELTRPFRLTASWLELPRAAVLTALVAASVTLARALRSRNPLEPGAFWTVVAATLALMDPRGARPSLLFAAGAVALAVSLIETSHAIAYGDELTGLPGRRALTEALARLDGTYTIAMVDIDHFKRFNDTYGHDVGDQLLRMVGARLGQVPGGGRAFRYGGEEFAVIFDGIRADDALPALETLRHSIETTGFALRGRDRPRDDSGVARRRGAAMHTVSVSVSIGVADSRRHGTPSAVVEAADAALYRAKRSGRNRVVS